MRMTLEKRKRQVIVLALAVATFVLAMSPFSRGEKPATNPDGTKSVPVVFTGGHDTDERDRGRPVVLIAAALGVPGEVFREAFSHVRPAQGREPTGDKARRNKHELLSRLEKYGVTNERLDEVSNYYRYRRERGELWTVKPATAVATVKDGKIIGFRIVDGGSGYLSPPKIAVESQPNLAVTVKLRFGKDLTKNGSIESISLAPPTTAP